MCITSQIHLKVTQILITCHKMFCKCQPRFIVSKSSKIYSVQSQFTRTQAFQASLIQLRKIVLSKKNLIRLEETDKYKKKIKVLSSTTKEQFSKMLNTIALQYLRKKPILKFAKNKKVLNKTINRNYRKRF